MSESFSMWSSMDLDQDSTKEAKANKKATEELAIKTALEHFGEFLASSSSKSEIEERWAMIRNDALNVMADHATPVPRIIRAFKSQVKLAWEERQAAWADGKRYTCSGCGDGFSKKSEGVQDAHGKWSCNTCGVRLGSADYKIAVSDDDDPDDYYKDDDDRVDEDTEQETNIPEGIHQPPPGQEDQAWEDAQMLVVKENVLKLIEQEAGEKASTGDISGLIPHIQPLVDVLNSLNEFAMNEAEENITTMAPAQKTEQSPITNDTPGENPTLVSPESRKESPSKSNEENHGVAMANNSSQRVFEAGWKRSGAQQSLNSTNRLFVLGYVSHQQWLADQMIKSAEAPVCTCGHSEAVHNLGGAGGGCTTCDCNDFDRAKDAHRKRADSYTDRKDTTQNTTEPVEDGESTALQSDWASDGPSREKGEDVHEEFNEGYKEREDEKNQEGQSRDDGDTNKGWTEDGKANKTTSRQERAAWHLAQAQKLLTDEA